jgi:ketosteroid isomerase-like protein
VVVLSEAVEVSEEVHVAVDSVEASVVASGEAVTEAVKDLKEAFVVDLEDSAEVVAVAVAAAVPTLK